MSSEQNTSGKQAPTGRPSYSSIIATTLINKQVAEKRRKTGEDSAEKDPRPDGSPDRNLRKTAGSSTSLVPYVGHAIDEERDANPFLAPPGEARPSIFPRISGDVSTKDRAGDTAEVISNIEQGQDGNLPILHEYSIN